MTNQTELTAPEESGGALSAWVLCSGSEGNCVYIRAGSDELLIDAGVSARAISRLLAELGSSLDRIGAVFITHEHIDHVRGLAQIIRRYHPAVHMVSLSAEAAGFREGVTLHPPVYSACCGAIEVSSFPASHDSAACVGYIVSCGGERIGVATDTGYVSRGMASALCGVDYAVLESNHDPELLMNGAYPPSLKQRILSRNGHLSNGDCSRLALHLAENGARRILLAHLSRDNNTPQLALSSCACAIAGANLSTSLAVASRSAPTRLC